jgi:hypothetical protein
VRTVAIYRLIHGSDFSSEQVRAMALAYEGALIDLRLKDRDDPLTELIAEKIAEHTRRGERDPATLRQRVVKELNGH